MPLIDLDLENQIIMAHEQNNTQLLTELYANAAQRVFGHDKACFFSTQAYVYSLQSNHPLKSKLKIFLKRHGREE